MPPITAGQSFDSLADFKTALRAWGIEDGFSPSILDSDARRVRAGCRSAPNCTFRVRCNFYQRENKATVTTLIASHTCQEKRDPENTSVTRGEVTKLRFLLDAVPQLMVIDQSTSTKDIIKNIKNRYGQEISLRQAQKVKSTLLSIASDQLGKDLYSRMRQKLGDDATDEEMRRGKRLRVDDDTIDPSLYEDGNDRDYQDDEMDDIHDAYDEDVLSDESTQQTRRQPRFDKTINKVSQLESNIEHVLEQAPSRTGSTAAELRTEAAALFQEASKKFQEASQLHMQASKLFSQATEMEEQHANG